MVDWFWTKTQRQFNGGIFVFSTSGIGTIGLNANEIIKQVLFYVQMLFSVFYFSDSSTVYSFFFLFSIPLLKYTHNLFICHLLVDNRIVSSLGLLWKNMLWTFLYESFWEHVLLFPWIHTQEYNCWLVWSGFWNVCIILHSHLCKSPVAPHLCQYLIFSVLFLFATSVGM